MTKQEFLSILQESLEGNIPQKELEENIRFYEDYFAESPKQEKMLCEELGDPRLIARSIIDSFIASKGSMADYYKQKARDEYNSSSRQKGQSGSFSGNDSDASSGIGQNVEKLFRRIFWVAVLILIVVVCVFALGFAIRILLPVVAVCLILKLLLDLFRKY